MCKKGLCLGAVLLILASISFSDEIKFGEISDQEWQMGAPDDYPDANAICIFDKGKLEVTTDGIGLNRHVRIKVLNQAGVDEVGDVSVWYWDDDKLTIQRAHTITPDGDKIDIDHGEIHTQSSGDRRAKTFSFRNVQPGCILEYKYRNYNKRFASLDPWYFQNDQYTLLSELSLVLSPGFAYSSVTNNVPAASSDPVESKKPFTDDRIFTWSMSNVLPMRDEPLACARYYFSPSLHCQMIKYQSPYQTVPFVKSWTDLGTYFTDIIVNDWISKDNGLQDLIERLASGEADTEQKLKKFYRFVCDSITLKGDGTSKYPDTDHLRDVLESRAALAGEKNLLLLQMAQKIGLTAYPILISTRDYGLFHPKIYQLQQLNHLIIVVMIDSENMILVDASSKYCPFGVLPPRSAVSAGFLVDGGDSRVISISVPEEKSYRLDNTIVRFDETGTAHCSTTVMLSGYFTDEFGRIYERMEEEDFCERFVLSSLDIHKTVENFEFIPSENRQRCTAVITYTSDEMSARLDDALLLTQPTLSFRSNPFTDDTRLFPIDFKFPATYHSVTTFMLDSTLMPTDLPERRERSIESASFVHQCNADDLGVRVESRLTINQALVAPAYYPEIKALFTDIESAFESPIVVVPRTAVAEGQ